MIQFEIDAHGIATLTIQQTLRAMNVIDWAFADALNERIDQIAQDPRITGVILTSGKSSFVAGADLAIMADFVTPGVTPRDAAQMIARIGSVLRRLETLGKPVVGASTGTALGGGLELLLACHYRVAADAPGAVYGLPEVSLGLLPGAGGTQRLPRLIGMAKALPIMLSGRHLKTAEAQALGLLHQVVPADQLLPVARQALIDGRVSSAAPWDQKGFRLPGGDSNSPAANELFLLLNGDHFGRTHGLQPAPKAIASCVYEGSRLPIDRALRIEQMYFAQLVQGHEAQAMISTLFFDRQAMEKAPGRPANVPRSKLAKIAVLGDAPWQIALKKLAEGAGLTVVADATAEADLIVGEGAGQLALRCFQAGSADLPPAVEIAPTASTTEEQLARAFDLARQLRAVPILLGASAPAAGPARFIGDCVEASLSAAHRLVASGVSPVVLDNTVMSHGWPSLRVLAAAIGEEWTMTGEISAPDNVLTPAHSGDIAQAQRRVAEAAVSASSISPSAANLAAVLGAGYPRHLGGPLYVADRL
jgi:3-hydroxyacyl-CoA dehydrogenase / enoyl-CoA hydratase / 3-hydroxybutyryl-CoA epimerase